MIDKSKMSEDAQLALAVLTAFGREYRRYMVDYARIAEGIEIDDLSFDAMVEQGAGREHALLCFLVGGTDAMEYRIIHLLGVCPPSVFDELDAIGGEVRELFRAAWNRVYAPIEQGDHEAWSEAFWSVADDTSLLPEVASVVEEWASATYMLFGARARAKRLEADAAQEAAQDAAALVAQAMSEVLRAALNEEDAGSDDDLAALWGMLN